MLSWTSNILGSEPRGFAPRRKKFDATLERSLALATYLGTLPPSTSVEAQDTLRRVTMVGSNYAQGPHCFLVSTCSWAA